MARIKALSIGTKLVLVAGPALFLNLSLTWQKLDVDFGRAGRAERLVDGWDFLGLLIGLVTLALVVLVVLVHLTDLELSPDLRWDLVIVGLGVAVFLLTVVKNVTDAGSTLASYVGIVLAAAIAVGASLDWVRSRTRQPTSVLKA